MLLTCKGKQSPVGATTLVQGGWKPPLTRRAGGVHERVCIRVLTGVRHTGEVCFVCVVGAVGFLAAGTAVAGVLVGLLLKAATGLFWGR